MGLVATWLNGIGLSYAVPTFQAAGIDNPAALAQLDVSYFEGLGVTDPEDRRKLFFLVQRIKMAVERRDESANEVDAVLARTMGPSMSLDHEEAIKSDPVMNSPSRQNEDDSLPSKENRSEEPVRKHQHRPRSPGPLPMRRHNESVVLRASPIAKQPSIVLDDSEEDAFASSDRSEEDNESDYMEDSGDESAEEEPPLPSPRRDTTMVTTRRRSARIMQKKKSSDSLSEMSSSYGAGHQSRLTQPSKAVGSRRKSDTSLLRGGEASSSASRPTNKRHSGVPAPSRRGLKNPSKSLRTGKQLSTIPSNSAAPMSPLMDVPTDSKLTQNQQKSEEERCNTNSKKQSRVSLAKDRRMSTESSKSIDDSRRRSTSASRRSSSGLRGRQTQVKPQSPKPSGVSTRNRSRNSAVDHSSRCSSASSSRKVSVQGRKPDTSFKAQISQLRADNDGDYELFDRPDDLEDETTEDMRIRVVVRKRPMSRSEITAAGDVDVIHPLDYGTYGRILVYNPKTRVDLTKSIETIPFAFDNAFDETSTNVQIYERSVRHLIPSLFDGQWASVFAYGQTGSGKTFTMMGSNATGMNDLSSSDDDGSLNPSNLGLYYMAALDLFQAIVTPGFEEFHIAASLFEIYSGKLFDLLHNKRQIKCLEDSKGKICFPGLTEHDVETADELMELIEEGGRNRSTGTTSRNADSSRSHAVLQLHLKAAGRRSDVEHSRLTFIDLAGSERGADTASASRATRLEGSEINTSLLALKEVIRALATGDSMAHVPFRGSRLTQVLKESFVGKDGRSVMIACVSPNIGNVETTLNTLRYADRVKERDAETGELSAAVASAAATSRPMINVDSMDDHGSIKPASSFHSLESSTSDVLDELLASPRKKTAQQPAAPQAEHENSHSETPDARTIAMKLIADHKVAMTTMLDMVKDEMTIVNEADSDREGLSDYVAKLSMIQEEQLSMIASLREHLLSYRILQASGDDDSDGSFEDLRD